MVDRKHFLGLWRELGDGCDKLKFEQIQKCHLSLVKKHVSNLIKYSFFIASIFATKMIYSRIKELQNDI